MNEQVPCNIPQNSLSLVCPEIVRAVKSERHRIKSVQFFNH